MGQAGSRGWGDPADVFLKLAGRWRIRRVIGAAGLEGEAVFSPDGVNLLYREQGILTLADGRSLEAERRYVFREAVQGFSVFFAERPFGLFHEISLLVEGEDLAGQSSHTCGADLYLSRYVFGGEGFRVTHRVRGPRKDYLSETAYDRVSATKTVFADRSVR